MNKKDIGWSGSERSEGKIIFRKFLSKTVMLMFGLIGILVYLVYFVAGYIMPMDKSDDRDVVIEVPLNSSSKMIGSILESNGIIRNGDIFYYYSRITGDAAKFQAGTYVMNKTYSLPEISKALGEGKLFAETYKVTIPEGYTITQIADLLDEKNVVEKDEFLMVVNDERFKELSFLKGITFPVDAKYFLEGMLFPKTYEFSKTDTTIDIIEKMLTQTANEIPEEWIAEINNQGKSLYEILILASIIEKEAVVPAERPIIAGVYYNRMAIDMKLQADATVQYALGGHKDTVLYSDLKIDSPYNTYKYIGLPPTPISNMGAESIKAAIYPESNEYFYYVTKKDGTRGHYFSTTYEQHLKNIEISKQPTAQ